jgi:hypothetical protein
MPKDVKTATSSKATTVLEVPIKTAVTKPGTPPPAGLTGSPDVPLTAIVDFSFDSVNLKNPDGSLPVTAINCTQVAGPGTNVLGNYSNALDFGTTGKVSLQLPQDKLSYVKFCARVAFQATVPVTGRENLLESNLLPFSLTIDKTNGTNEFKVVATVNNAINGWCGTTTEFFTHLQTNKWYVADLVYDVDTLGLFIDGNLVSVHAFPNGTLATMTGKDLDIGVWVDGARNHFAGQIAAVKLYAGIPADLEAALDEHRTSPEWFISFKYEQLKGTVNLGNPKDAPTYDYNAQAWLQDYDNGLMMYNESIGTAFEMHGAIWGYYKTLTSAERADFCYLVSDEGNTTKPGGRKSVFRKGGIYWSGATGAIPVTGQIYVDYEMWGESKFIGFPKSKATNIASGVQQVFEGANVYYKNGASNAFEVHGAILTKFLNTGGVSKWGYPVSNEEDIKNNNTSIGRISEFEGCTIYWSGASGAYEVHGDIRQKYRDLKGPLSQLGFPTSDEGNVPGGNGARYNTFQHGSILWFGNWSNMYVCYPFKIFHGRVDSVESEGLFMGQNDLYWRTTIDDNGHQIYNQRFPSSGDYDGHDIYDLNQELNCLITPNDPNRNIKLTMDIWESDSGAPFGGGDDHLGVYTKTFNMANAWGLAENNGVISSGKFSMINNITIAIHPQINESVLSMGQKWWGVQNKGTNELSYDQYGEAFLDIDSQPEWWDLLDWIDKLYYQLAIKGIAAGGNCFGMSLESIYSWKHRSLFSLPLDRFTNWNTCVNEFNVKHEYQAGSQAIWWFVGKFLSGETHDPKSVFTDTMNAFYSGNDPVVCIAQNWDFSGAPHCIRPVGWDTSSKPWKMTMLDPNFPATTRTLFVDPDQNTFSYDGGNKYSGGEWSGGRFYYMPYTTLCEYPRSPIWDLILLVLTGTILFLGSDAETQSLTDENGTDLDIFGQDTINRQKSKKVVENKFFSVKGFGGRGVLTSEMHMRTERDSSFSRIIGNAALATDFNMNMTLGQMMSNKSVGNNMQSLANNTQLNSLKNRKMSSIVNDTKTLTTLSPDVVKAISDLQKMIPVEKNFVHNVKGNKANGQFQYAVMHQMSAFQLQSNIGNGEVHSVNVKDLGTPSNIVNVKAGKDKTVSLTIANKLGAGKDAVNITIDNIPASAAQNLQVNVKPGLAGLDIVASSQKANANIQVQTTINGKVNKYQFQTDIANGIRIRPSSVLTTGQLKVGSIDNLFGQIQNVIHLKGK